MESYLTLLTRLVVVAFVAVVAAYVITPVAEKIIAPLTTTVAKAAPEESPKIQEPTDSRVAIYSVICMSLFLLGSVTMVAWQTRTLMAVDNLVSKLNGNIQYQPELSSFLLRKFQCETIIDLSSSELNDSNMPDFAVFPRLKSLRIASTAISNQSSTIIRRCKNLRSLDVSETGIDDEFIRQISSLPDLETIIASNTKISDDCADSLTKIKSLKKIECFNTEFTRVGAEVLNGLKPELIVRYA